MKKRAISNTFTCVWFYLYIMASLGIVMPAMSDPISQQLVIIIQADAWQQLSSEDHRDALIDSWSESFQVDLSFVRQFGTNGWVIKLEKQVPTTELAQLIDEINQNAHIESIEEDSRGMILPNRPGLY